MVTLIILLRMGTAYLTLGVAGGSGEAWLGAVNSAVMLVGVIFSGAWFASEVLVRSVGLQETPFSMIARAVSIVLVLAVGVAIGRAGGFAQGLSDLATSFARAVPYLVGAAAWGTVFWLRAPRPQTAGVAA
ncbi:hypothetical protein [Maricaulis salignorans]|nr:hypothetical protein [Maricaulis salignorans]